MKKSMSENREKSHKELHLITLKEACEMLKVHPNTMRQWDAKGVLPAIRIGIRQLRRYRKEDILNFLNKRHS